MGTGSVFVFQFFHLLIESLKKSFLALDIWNFGHPNLECFLNCDSAKGFLRWEKGVSLLKIIIVLVKDWQHLCATWTLFHLHVKTKAVDRKGTHSTHRLTTIIKSIIPLGWVILENHRAFTALSYLTFTNLSKPPRFSVSCLISMFNKNLSKWLHIFSLLLFCEHLVYLQSCSVFITILPLFLISEGHVLHACIVLLDIDIL